MGEGLLYTKEHEWIKKENSVGIIGITFYAQTHLGDITFVELPKAGSMLKQFESFAQIESIKAVSDIYAPASGEVIEVNESLRENPEKINQSPYEEGWICKIKMDNTDELSALMDEARYKEYLEGLS